MLTKLAEEVIGTKNFDIVPKEWGHGKGDLR